MTVRRPGLAGTVLVLGTLAFAFGCDSAEERPAAGDQSIEAPLDTIVTTASDMIAHLSDMKVGGTGLLYLLDMQASQVHVIDSTGNSAGEVAQAGEGPGELMRPTSLALTPDSLMVVDFGNQRIQSFSLEGEVSSSYEFPGCAQGVAPPVLDPASGVMIRPTIGFDDSLAIVCSVVGEEKARIGDLVVPAEPAVNVDVMREQIRDGEIPAMFLNATEAVGSADGSTWLVLPGTHQVLRYEPSGEKTLAVELDEPGFEAVEEAWREEASADGQMGVPALAFLLHAQEVEGNLWVLANTVDESFARLVSVSPAGDTRSVQVNGVQGARRFAIDESTGWVYFYVEDTAEIIRVAFEPELYE